MKDAIVRPTRPLFPEKIESNLPVFHNFVKVMLDAIHR
jgi:hypothetical protein